MTIIGLYDEFGPSYHRIYLPLHTIRGVDKILITNVLTEARIEAGCDVLFFNRIPPANKIDEVLAWRKKYGFKIVVDMDDHFKLDYNHILAKYYDQLNISNTIVTMLTEADAVTCTHERLGHILEAYNRNVWVLPNAIANVDQFAIQPTTSEKVRLFWAGSITHEKDIAILSGPMKRIAGSHLKNKVFAIIGGYHDNERVWQKMVHHYTAGLRIPGNVLYSRKVQEYYGMYRYADVCLIPLVDSNFNTHKSNLKVLEAAHLARPVVVSAVHPYLDFPTDLVNYVYKQSDWVKHITHLTNDADFRKEQGQRLHDYCQQHYNYDYINSHRLKLFESLCLGKS